MSRLINAEKYRAEFLDASNREYNPMKILDMQPTVKAVPIEVLDDIKSDLWMEGMNMTGEYQGVWVRFKEIERIFDKHLKDFKA